LLERQDVVQPHDVQVVSGGTRAADAALLAQDFEAIIADQGFVELPITVRHARLAGEMNIANKDPFDRLLIAQALAEDKTLVSNETPFDGFAVKRLW
jgi:PIN domain nuclease of toxin-antitoxin system